MFVCASSECFSDRPFADACHQLVELEFDRIEIWMDEASSHLRPSDVGGQPDRFAAQFREITRMTPVALHLKHDVDASLFEGLCRVGKLLKITQITLPAAPLGSPFNEEIDRLRSRLRSTNEAGIRLSLKTSLGTLTEDPRTAVELCQSVPGLGVTLDPAHLNCGPHAAQPLEPVCPYVYHVHFRDSTAKELQVRVGLGEIDYNRLVGTLRRFGYQRGLSVEILPELLADTERGLELRKMRMLLDSLL